MGRIRPGRSRWQADVVYSTEPCDPPGMRVLLMLTLLSANSLGDYVHFQVTPEQADEISVPIRLSQTPTRYSGVVPVT